MLQNLWFCHLTSSLNALTWEELGNTTFATAAADDDDYDNDDHDDHNEEEDDEVDHDDHDNDIKFCDENEGWSVQVNITSALERSDEGRESQFEWVCLISEKFHPIWWWWWW